MNTDTVEISWCRDVNEAAELARFFAANVTPEYISHAELQGPRALDVARWRPGLVDIFLREISDRIAQTGDRVSPKDASYPVLTARSQEKLLGLALVSFLPNAP